MKADMSPQAVTKRIRQTSELRRLCLFLGKNDSSNQKKNIVNIEKTRVGWGNKS